MRTLLIEDDPSTRDYLENVLERRGHIVTGCEDAETAWEKFQAEPYPFVLVDWMLPGKSGLDLCRDIRKLQSGRSTLLFVCTARRNAEDLREVLNSGADDYIAKPLDPDVFALRISLAENLIEARTQRLPVINSQARSSDIKAKPKASVAISTSTSRIVPVFKAPSMHRLFAMADDAAKVNSSVLILGESGSGKEILADHIHFHSDRRNGHFVKVNCAALPEHLLESELFGHEKGAFTGADRRTIGRFEQANGGTLFLDEIGDLPPSLQVKLLRALQEKAIERVGSSTSVHVDFRLISATHQNLHADVLAGKFREDLYYRLNVVPLVVPALRERKEDIKLLLDYFLKLLGNGSRKATRFSDDAYECLTSYPWPGNIRQLRNAVEYAVVLCKTEIIGRADLPDEITSPRDPLPAGNPRSSGTLEAVASESSHELVAEIRGLKGSVHEREKEVIQRSIEKHHWQISEVAKELKICRSTLYIRMKHYGIRRR